MKKFTLATAALIMIGGAVIAQDAPKETAAKTPATPVENPCENKVQVTDLSGIEASGSKNYDYFLQLKNVTQHEMQVDIKFTNFPESSRIYSSLQKDIKLKPGKPQSIRFGTGTSNNISPRTVLVQVDKTTGKKATISIINCREKM